MMNQTNQLTLEQEFNLRHFADQVGRMSHEQAQEFLIEQHRVMMVQETMYRDLLKQEWKLEQHYVSSEAKK
jgi:Phycobilisome degradation protein nblA